MNMKQHDIHTYLEKAKKNIVERGLCDNYGEIEFEGHHYLHTILHGGESWGELWNSDSVWIPGPEYDYASVEEMSNKDVWRYVYNHGLTEKRSKFKDLKSKKNWLCPWDFKRPGEITELMYTNFCKYFDIENEVGLITKEVYLADDDDTFIV